MKPVEFIEDAVTLHGDKKPSRPLTYKGGEILKPYQKAAQITVPDVKPAGRWREKKVKSPETIARLEEEREASHQEVVQKGIIGTALGLDLYAPGYDRKAVSKAQKAAHAAEGWEERSARAAAWAKEHFTFNGGVSWKPRVKGVSGGQLKSCAAEEYHSAARIATNNGASKRLLRHCAGIDYSSARNILLSYCHDVGVAVDDFAYVSWDQLGVAELPAAEVEVKATVEVKTGRVKAWVSAPVGQSRGPVPITVRVLRDGEVRLCDTHTGGSVAQRLELELAMLARNTMPKKDKSARKLARNRMLANNRKSVCDYAGEKEKQTILMMCDAFQAVPAATGEKTADNESGDPVLEIKGDIRTEVADRVLSAEIIEEEGEEGVDESVSGVPLAAADSALVGEKPADDIKGKLDAEIAMLLSGSAGLASDASEEPKFRDEDFCDAEEEEVDRSDLAPNFDEWADSLRAEITAVDQRAVVRAAGIAKRCDALEGKISSAVLASAEAAASSSRAVAEAEKYHTLAMLVDELDLRCTNQAIEITKLNATVAELTKSKDIMSSELAIFAQKWEERDRYLSTMVAKVDSLSAQCAALLESKATEAKERSSADKVKPRKERSPPPVSDEAMAAAMTPYKAAVSAAEPAARYKVLIASTVLSTRLPVETEDAAWEVVANSTDASRAAQMRRQFVLVKSELARELGSTAPLTIQWSLKPRPFSVKICVDGSWKDLEVPKEHFSSERSGLRYLIDTIGGVWEFRKDVPEIKSDGYVKVVRDGTKSAAARKELAGAVAEHLGVCAASEEGRLTPMKPTIKDVQSAVKLLLPHAEPMLAPPFAEMNAVSIAEVSRAVVLIYLLSGENITVWSALREDRFDSIFPFKVVQFCRDIMFWVALTSPASISSDYNMLLNVAATSKVKRTSVAMMYLTTEPAVRELKSKWQSRFPELPAWLTKELSAIRDAQHSAVKSVPPAKVKFASAARPPNKGEVVTRFPDSAPASSTPKVRRGEARKSENIEASDSTNER